MLLWKRELRRSSGGRKGVGWKGGGAEVVPQVLSPSQELSQKEVKCSRNVYLEINVPESAIKEA